MSPMSEPQKPELTAVSDPEVLDRPRRRSFTAAYKLSILRELDACTEPGQAGAVLRLRDTGLSGPPVNSAASGSSLAKASR